MEISINLTGNKAIKGRFAIHHINGDTLYCNKIWECENHLRLVGDISIGGKSGEYGGEIRIELEKITSIDVINISDY